MISYIIVGSKLKFYYVLLKCKNILTLKYVFTLLDQDFYGHNTFYLVLITDISPWDMRVFKLFHYFLIM